MAENKYDTSIHKLMEVHLSKTDKCHYGLLKIKTKKIQKIRKEIEKERERERA
jgi:hypothetical protein